MKNNPFHQSILLLGTLLVGLVFWGSCDPDDDNPGPCQGRLWTEGINPSIKEYFPYKGGEKLIYQLITPHDTDTFSYVVQQIEHFYDTQYVDNSGPMEPETCDTIVYEKINGKALDEGKNSTIEIRVSNSGIYFGDFTVNAVAYGDLRNGIERPSYQLIDRLDFNDMSFEKVMKSEICEKIPFENEFFFYNSDVGFISACVNVGDGFELLKLIEYEK